MWNQLHPTTARKRDTYTWLAMHILVFGLGVSGLGLLKYDMMLRVGLLGVGVTRVLDAAAVPGADPAGNRALGLTCMPERAGQASSLFKLKLAQLYRPLCRRPCA
jgi:hypothetical protein